MPHTDQENNRPGPLQQYLGGWPSRHLPPSANPRSNAHESHIIKRMPFSFATLAKRWPIGSPFAQQKRVIIEEHHTDTSTP